MMKITCREWKHHCKDYKCIIDGQKYIMHNGGLEPVEIDDENGIEMCKWTFTEFGIKYSVVAYSEEDAWKTIKSSTNGHCLKIITDLKNEGFIHEK